MPSLDEVLSQMQPEAAVEVDFDNYADAAEFPPPVPRGEYTLIQLKPRDFAGRDGNLTAVLDHKITGGEHDGRMVTFDRVSTKPFDRDGVKVSQAADYLRAIGTKPSSVFANTKEPKVREWGEFFVASEGKPWKGVLDWEGSCEPCRKASLEANPNPDRAERKKWTLTGERNFPLSPSGGRLSTNVPCPNCKQPTIEARQRVVRRIPANAS